MQLGRSQSQGSLVLDASHRKHRRRQLEYVMTGSPFSPNGSGIRHRLNMHDRLHQLQAALDKGDVEKLRSLTAIVAHEPMTRGSEVLGVAQACLRQFMQCRKLCKENQSLLETSPMQYPCELIESNLITLKSAPVGAEIWNDELLARANIMADLGLLKLLRSLRPVPGGGGKATVDALRCARSWLSLTEAGVMSRQLAVTTASQLSKLPRGGAALGAVLAEPVLRCAYGGQAHLTCVTEGFWRVLWNGGNFNKDSPLELQLVLVGPARGLADLKPLLGRRRAEAQELLVRAPPEVLRTIAELFQDPGLDAVFHAEAPAEERAAHLAELLQPVPAAVLATLCSQGLLPAALHASEPAAAAAALQSCAMAVGARAALVVEDPNSPGAVLAACLDAAASALARAGGDDEVEIVEEALLEEMNGYLSECRAILEDLGNLEL